MQPRRCWVFVLGDYGRSPRMQYHTHSLLTRGFQVTIIGSPGSKPLEVITSDPNFLFQPVSQPPRWIQWTPSLLRFVLKTIFQLVYLLVLMLWTLPRPEFVLIQIPPAIPTLWLCAVVHCFKKTKMYLDWHNFAYTLLALNPQAPRILVKISKWVEMNCWRFADGHFCVSKAMKVELEKWGIQAHVLYDKPHGRFQSCGLLPRHHLMKKLKPLFQSPLHPDDFCMKLHKDFSEENTIQTESLPDGKLQLKQQRPALIVSSTSWTPDEDFSVLLEAAELYDHRWRSQEENSHPQLVIIVTGKGPLKEEYLQKMKNKNFKGVAFRTAWLEASDYPLLLGCADLGVSLHTSSSGVDLPMKVVDMFGSQLPVCGVNYAAIAELIQHQVNGVLFSTSAELSQALWELLEHFPSAQCDQLLQLKTNLEKGKCGNWEETWEEVAGSVINVLHKK